MLAAEDTLLMQTNQSIAHPRFVSLLILTICMIGLGTGKTAKAADTATSRPVHCEYTRSPQEYQIKPLPHACDLPCVPAYTGKHCFLNGTVMPNIKGGAMVTQRSAMQEAPSVVIGWYKACLSGYGWTINQDCSKQATLAAVHKDHQRIFISVAEGTKPGYATDCVIKYSFATASEDAQ